MAIQVPSHHVTASENAFGETVIMPGDPLRARYIADTYLEDAEQINSARCMYAYTGFYRDTRVSVMAHGIGAPSIYTYVCELFDGYGVKEIIRVGTAGALHADIPLRQMIAAMSASYNTSVINSRGCNAMYAPSADYLMMKTAVQKAEELSIPCMVGSVFSTDVFYPEEEDPTQAWLASMGCLAVEMETAALYYAAARYGKRALSLLTVSDNVVTGEKTTADERQNSFTDMLRVALETVIGLKK